MARKGILPRRKRGRASVVPITGDAPSPNPQLNSNNFANITVRDMTNSSEHNNRSESPYNEPPFHFANFKLPDMKQELI